MCVVKYTTSSAAAYRSFEYRGLPGGAEEERTDAEPTRSEEG